MSPPPISSQPSASASDAPAITFDRIALSLSGGGFRASAYSLGTLNGLYLLGLLDQVHMLSTASGGTLTGAFYALRRKQGQLFGTIYSDFYNWLQADSLLPTAIANWQKAIGSTGDNYKYIRAFATVYDSALYDQALFGAFWEKDAPADAPFHLQTVVFGTTELYSGITFRFQQAAFLPDTFSANGQKLYPSYLVGNGNVHIHRSRAREIRLADVVATSSCLPVGFEPMVLPDDFFPASAPPTALLGHDSQPLTIEKLALIDGGIYDNQGIESLLTANQRNAAYRNSPDFAGNTLTPAQQTLLQPSTLFLVSDVDGATVNLYDAPTPGPQSGNSPSLTRLRQHLKLAVLSLLAVLGIAIGLSSTGTSNFTAGLIAGCAGVILALLLAVRWLMGRLTTVLRKVNPGLFDVLMPPLAMLSLKQWVYLLKVRLTSTLVLLDTVFLRRIRSLDYGLLYHSPLPPNLYGVLPSIISRIVNDFQHPHQPDPNHPSVRDELKAVYDTVRIAATMPTTLWWQANLYRLPLIVASAEITLCYQLLLRFEKNPPSDARGQEVNRRAQLIWAAYQRGGPTFRTQPGMLATLENPACTVDQLLASVTT